MLVVFCADKFFVTLNFFISFLRQSFELSGYKKRRCCRKQIVTNSPLVFTRARFVADDLLAQRTTFTPE